MRRQARYTFAMQSTPLYQPENLSPAYQLRYSWTGFPRRGTSFPAKASLAGMEELTAAWETDGIRLLEHRWGTEKLQATFSLLPHVSPTLLAARAKGRLQYAMRK